MKDFIDINLIEEAEVVLNKSGLIYETPLLKNVGYLFNLPNNIELYLKLESMQTNGSFKLRGVINQFNNINLDNKDQKLVTFSAGNFGKAFSFLCSKTNKTGKVLLPSSAAESRIRFIQSHGVEIEQFSNDKLLNAVEEHVKNGWKLVHPLDDLYLIAGYSPMAKEILKIVEPDITLVCCGGGSLLAGLSSGLALYGSKSIVYGVEPNTADTMKQSFENNYAVKMPNARSIATGLAPPMAGNIAYQHCKKYVKNILLVSDQEIIETCKRLFDVGLKVEPSGCAALAALLTNKVPNLNSEKKLKIVVILSGSNVSLEELQKL